jgi:hypothetical protein
MTENQNAQQLNNPMAQLAKVYKIVEERLRRATNDNAPISMAQLLEKPDLQDAMKNADQVRHTVKTMTDKGFVIKIGTFVNAKYKWNPNAGPFTLETKTARLAQKTPSEVKITKKEPTPREIELVIDDVTIVVGKNPATGRIRVIIE